MNGLSTSHRVAAFSDAVVESRCFLCGMGEDSVDHLVRCNVTRELAATVGFANSDLDVTAIQQPWTDEAHLLQGMFTGEQVQLILNINFAI